MRCRRRCANKKMDPRLTEFKGVKDHNSRNTCRMAFISLHSNLHTSTSMCTKFGETVKWCRRRCANENVDVRIDRQTEMMTINDSLPAAYKNYDWHNHFAFITFQPVSSFTISDSVQPALNV